MLPIALAAMVAGQFVTSNADGTDGLSSDLQYAVQGAELMAMGLPQHGPTPNPQAEGKMQQAGSLIYGAYEFLQRASTGQEMAEEQLSARNHVDAVASNLASAKEMLELGSAKLKDGKKLEQEAESMLQNQADALGPPPEAPQQRVSLSAMSRRAVSNS